MNMLRILDATDLILSRCYYKHLTPLRADVWSRNKHILHAVLPHARREHLAESVVARSESRSRAARLLTSDAAILADCGRAIKLWGSDQPVPSVLVMRKTIASSFLLAKTDRMGCSTLVGGVILKNRRPVA